MSYKYQMYADKDGMWRWSFIAPNNKRLATSSNAYKKEENCLNAIRLIQEKSSRSKTTKIVPVKE